MQEEQSVMTISKPLDWALSTLTLIIAITGTLVIAEVSLRIYRDSDRFFPYYPNTVQYHYPSEEITPGISGVSKFTTNSYGTRGREPNGDEDLRILTVGGSTTACTILDDDETWPALLDKALNDKINNPGAVWVTNSGVDGHNSEHHLMHVKYLLPQLPDIDYVIIYAGTNDVGIWLHNKKFDKNYLEDQDNWNSRVGESFRWSAYTPADWPVYKRLEIWKLASRLKDIYISRRTMANDRAIVQDAQLEWLEDVRRKRQENKERLLPLGKIQSLPDALNSYERTLTAIVQTTREQGSEPILMAQAVQSIFLSQEERDQLWMGVINDGDGYISEDQYPGILDQYNKRMQKVAEVENVLFIDLPAKIDKGHKPFYDGMHFNEWGANAVAKVVADFFISNELLNTDKE